MAKRIPLAVRIQRYVQPDANGCWIWIGAVDKRSGYGRIMLDGRTAYSHRVVYELLVGPIPEGLQLDHVCRVRACCNPDHLEPVTPAVNTRRAPHVHKAVCNKGHALVGANLCEYVDVNGYRHRACRICNITRSREWRKSRAA